MIAGCILRVIVPATTITSVWRGSGRGNVPSRSKSNFENDAAMSSIAQHAVPIGMAHSDCPRAQSASASTLVRMTPPPDERSRRRGQVVYDRHAKAPFRHAYRRPKASSAANPSDRDATGERLPLTLDATAKRRTASASKMTKSTAIAA